MTHRFFLDCIKVVNLNRLFSIFIVAAATLLTGAPASAQGLMLAPTRLIFEKGTRSAEVMISNRGNRTNRFRILFENKRFSKDGQVELLSEERDGLRFANAMLRLSTREVTLKPGEEQTVRIMLRRMENMTDGEYRSHLTVRSIAEETQPATSLGIAVGKTEKGEDFAVNVVPQYGISIPVLVRQGITDADIDIKATDLLPASDGAAGKLGIDLATSGNRSVFANIQVIDRSRSGADAMLFNMRNLSIYSPTNARYVLLALEKKHLDAIRAGHAAVVVQQVDPTSGNAIKSPIERKL